MNVFEQDPLKRLANELADWEGTEVAAFLNKQPERRPEFFTTGDLPVKRVKRRGCHPALMGVGVLADQVAVLDATARAQSMNRTGVCSFSTRWG